MKLARRGRAATRGSCRWIRGGRRAASRTREDDPSAQKTDWLAKFLRRTTVRCSCSSGPSREPNGWRESSPARAQAAALHADRTQAEARRRSKASAADASGPRRHRRSGARPRHRRHHARRELRSTRLAEPYVHRVGRTARADATGTALTLVAPEELRALQALQRSVGSSCRDNGRFQVIRRLRRCPSRRSTRRRRSRRRRHGPGRVSTRRSRSSSRAAGAPRPTRASSVPTGTCCRLRARKVSSRTRGVPSARSTSCAARRRSASGSTTATNQCRGAYPAAYGLASSQRIPSPAPPTPPPAPAPDTSSSAASLRRSARSSRA